MEIGAAQVLWKAIPWQVTRIPVPPAELQQRPHYRRYEDYGRQNEIHALIKNGNLPGQGRKKENER
jgi:hypothetical protein